MDKMLLSLDTDTFSVLKEQFDRVLNKTLGNMEMKGAENAVITLKLDIELDKDSRDTGNGFKDFTLPKFKHTISSVMQVKDKASGELTGDYAMVFDSESGQYVLQKMEDGQQDLFEKADYQDVEFAEVPKLEEGARGLPAPGDEKKSSGKNNYPTEGDSCDTGDSTEYPDSGIEPESFRVFAWLQQFVGETMNVTEAMGNYTVRSSKNKIVLSSATTSDSPFYCPAEKLKDHVGHALMCIGYGDEQLERISVECPDCGEVVYEMMAPWANDGGEGYAYDSPEL